MHMHVLICLGRGARWIHVITDPVNIEFWILQLILAVTIKIFTVIYEEVLFGTNN